MIKITDKEGNILLETNKKPKDLHFNFEGDVQSITTFELSQHTNFQVNISETLLEILYQYHWRECGL